MAGLGAMQFGIEASGTPGVAVTTMDHFLNFEAAEWQNDPDIHQPELMTNSYARHTQGVTRGNMGLLTLRGGLLDYEQVTVFLAASLKRITPTGSTAGRLWDFDPSMTADEAIATLTLRARNDDVQAMAVYGFVESFEVACDGPRAQTTLMAEIKARPWDWAGTIIAAVSDTEPEQVQGGAWTVFIDDAGGTIGTTEYPGCLKSFRLNSGPLREPFDCMDSTNVFSGVNKSLIRPELTLRMVVDEQAEALMDDFDNGTRKLIRLKAVGSDIGAGTPKSIQFDVSGRITGFSRIGSAVDQGAWVVEMTVSGEKDPTWGKVFRATVVNAESALRGT